MSGADRHFEPTRARLLEARRQGHVARTAELPAAVSVTLAALVIGFGGWAGCELLMSLMSSTFGASGDLTGAGGPAGGALASVLPEAGRVLAMLTLPVFAAALLGALLAGMIPGGWLVSHHYLPRPSRLSPAVNVPQLFALRSLARLALHMLRVLAIGGAAGIYGWTNRGALAEIAGASGAGAISAAIAWLLPMAALSFGAWLTLALADVFIQRRLFIRDWRMSAQDMRDEQREQQASPSIRQRQKQRPPWPDQDYATLIPRAVMVLLSEEATAIRGASPGDETHLAVALAYDPARMKAPMVLACGRGRQAQSMVQLAEASHVPLVHDAAASAELANQFPQQRIVPAHLFDRIARVLADAMVRRQRDAALVGEGI